MSKIKFSVFADLHHFPEAFYSNTPEKLKYIQKKALNNNAEFIVSLGDFCHKPEDSLELIGQLKNSGIPTYHTLGNHDSDHCSFNKCLNLYDMPAGYYHFDCKGFRFVVLDTNYVLINNKIHHFEKGNYYNHPDTREFIPDEELKWLEESIYESPYPCILFSHASFERESRASVLNRNQIIEIIRKANNRKKHQVLIAINGHHHRDFLRIHENVAYFDLNSVSFDWVNNPHDFYPDDLCKKHKFMANTIIFNEALHAIVSIDSSGEIEIEGMKGSFYQNITREMTDNPKCDNAGRHCTPNVLSAKFKIY